MLSVIDICNKALSLINISSISDLAEASAQARACSFHYEISRDSLLREHPWGFARTFATLAQTNISHPHWEYVYALPPEYLYGINIIPSDDSVSAVNGIIMTEVPGQFAIEAAYRYELANMDGNRVILSNVSEAMMEYIKRITDVTVFDATFVDALSYKLASDMAMPLTGDSRLAAYYNERYVQALQHAKVMAANEAKHKPLPRARISSFTRARR